MVPCGSEHLWVFVHLPHPLASPLVWCQALQRRGGGRGAAHCHSGQGSSVWRFQGAGGPVAAPSMVWGARLCPRVPGIVSGVVFLGVACGQGQVWLFWKQPGQHWPQP